MGKLFLFLLPLTLAAADLPPDIDKRLADLDKAVKNAQSAGDNAWMLVSAALVLMMTGPGLALFYGGLVRRKNVLCHHDAQLHPDGRRHASCGPWSATAWLSAIGTSFVGGGQYRFPERRRRRAQSRLRRHHPAADLHGLSAHVRDHHPRADFRSLCRAHEILRACCCSPPMDADSSISRWPTWSGARADSSTPPCLEESTSPASISPAEPSCTSLSGVSALVCALYLGPRKGYQHEPMRPHNLVLCSVGACLLWVGWFGFNAGSALAASALATSAFVATHFAAATAALAWLGAEWIVTGKPSLLGADFRSRRRTGRHHSGFGLRQAFPRDADRSRRRRHVLPDGQHREKQIRL